MCGVRRLECGVCRTAAIQVPNRGRCTRWALDAIDSNLADFRSSLLTACPHALLDGLFQERSAAQDWCAMQKIPKEPATGNKVCTTRALRLDEGARSDQGRPARQHAPWT